jgi:hypothetical protein
MGAPRKLATGLLRAVLRLVPEESRQWATAMLHELDFVDGDWAALFWALGSVTAILRHAASVFRMNLKRPAKEAGMNNTGRKALGITLGALSALFVAGCAFPLLRLISLMFPELGYGHASWPYWLTVIMIPEAIFAVATVLLWRKRGPVAAGILATALIMGLHVAVHAAMH